MTQSPFTSIIKHSSDVFQRRKSYRFVMPNGHFKFWKLIFKTFMVLLLYIWILTAQVPTSLIWKKFFRFVFRTKKVIHVCNDYSGK